jgi:hypothetical protein
VAKELALQRLAWDPIVVTRTEELPEKSKAFNGRSGLRGTRSSRGLG